jgi:hypothetical protein
MTFPVNPRAVAEALLQAALKIAPPHAADWGRAMLGELHHVEGNWAALAWALGSAGVLAKHALFAALIPGHANPIASSGGNFFSKEKPMRKTIMIAAAACIAASLLFFAIPGFRQAFQISLAQWPATVAAIRGVYSPSSLPAFAKLEAQARKQNDAEGIAFVALHEEPPTGAPLADEAVRMDPKLTWIYGAIGARGWNYPQRAAWIPKLEQLDSQNALPHLMEAQNLEWSDVMASKRYPFDAYERDPKWLNAMAAAFASTKIDIYSDRLKDLDQAIARRYGSDLNFDDPYVAQREYFTSQGLINYYYAFDYAKMIAASGDALAARGDPQGAQQQYWLVIHFGEMWQPSGNLIVGEMLQDLYKRMASLYAKQGDANQAQFFAFLSSSVEVARQQDREAARTLWANESIERWSANILQLSGAILLLSAGILAACAIVVVAKSRTLNPARLSASSVTWGVTLASAIGVLFSSATLYLSYRPYDAIVRAFVQNGDRTRMGTLSLFLGQADSPLGLGTFYRSAGIVFWTGVVAVCAVALIAATAKFLSQHRNQPAH